MFFDFASFLPRAVMQGIPLLYGSTGCHDKLEYHYREHVYHGVPEFYEIFRTLEQYRCVLREADLIRYELQIDLFGYEHSSAAGCAESREYLTVVCRDFGRRHERVRYGKDCREQKQGGEGNKHKQCEEEEQDSGELYLFPLLRLRFRKGSGV